MIEIVYDKATAEKMQKMMVTTECQRISDR